MLRVPSYLIKYEDSIIIYLGASVALPPHKENIMHNAYSAAQHPAFGSHRLATGNYQLPVPLNRFSPEECVATQLAWLIGS